jgi:hypothetical protein
MAHSKPHGRQSYTCAGCGKTFSAFLSDRTRRHTFCTRACFLRVEAARKRGKRVTRPCGYCGEPVTKPKSRDTGKQLFCNRRHYLAWRHGKPAE